MKILYGETLVSEVDNELMIANFWQLEDYFETEDRSICLELYKHLSKEVKQSFIDGLEENLKLYQDDTDWLDFLKQIKTDYENQKESNIITLEDLYQLSVSEIQNEIYGWNEDTVTLLDPDQIFVHEDCNDLDSIYHAVEKFDSEFLWAKDFVGHSLVEPIEVSYCEDGKFHIEDGHHQWYASKILGIPIKAKVTVKRNTLVDYVKFHTEKVFDRDVYEGLEIRKEDGN